MLITAREMLLLRIPGFTGTRVRLEFLDMRNHSDRYEQLVVELYVRDFKESCEFYQAFGFQMIRDEGDFAELQWEDALLFLEANSNALPPLLPFPLAIYVFWFQMLTITGYYPSRWVRR